MLLKRLELRGFKSFADLAVIEFDRGVTAVVGPNGSGKSNVADAIRWVLGEQSLRQIRSKKTEDIIFAGSSMRNSVGMAEVSLTFDNSDGRFNLPFSEVVITRRAYRSGENEYLINRERSRYRDMVELLQRANVACNGYTVIGQGLIDMALSLKADERRALLEEAADVKRYRSRLAEAREKLLATQQNIVRANDVAGEIRPRLLQLEEAARRLNQHQEIARELRWVQRQWFVHQWNKVSQRLSEGEVVETQIKSNLQCLRDEQRSLAQVLETLAGRRLELETAGRDHRVERGRLLTRQQEVQKALAVQRERQSSAAGQIREIEGEITSLAAEHEAEQNRVAVLRSRLDELAGKSRLADEQVREVERTLTLCREKRRTVSIEAEAAQQRVFETATRCAESRNRLNSLHDRVLEIQKEQSKQQRLGEEWQKKQAAHHAALEAAQQQVKALEIASLELSERRTRLSAQIEEKRTMQQESLARQSDLKAQLGQLRTRMDLLSRLKSSHAGYYAGVKAVLDASEGKGRPGSLSGVVGVVAALIKAPAKLETAIEMALGAQAQNVVMARWDDAAAAIEFLKRARAGRATFLPLDTLSQNVRNSGRTGTGWAPKEPGVLGIAADLVQYEPHLAPVATYLLGRTLVVDNLDTARRILKHFQGGGLIVTLAGELVRPGGAITGGSADKQGAVGLLTRERELRELPQSIAALEKSSAAVAETLSELRREEISLTGQRTETDEQLRQNRRQTDEANRTLNNAQREADRLEREATWWQAAQERLENELRALGDREKQITVDLQEGERQLAHHGQHNNAVKQKLAEAEAAEREASTAVNEVGRQVALVRGEIQSAKELLETRLERLSGLDKQVAQKRKRIADIAERLSMDRDEQADLERDLNSYTAALGDVERALGELAASLQALAEQEQATRGESARLTQRVNEVELSLRDAAGEVSKCLDEANRLRHQAESEDPDGEWAASDWNPRQLLLPFIEGRDDNGEERAVVILDPEELKGRLDELKARLRALGPINPQAAAEYEEVQNRHSFLLEQAVDLEKASIALQRVISELEKASRQRFKETFDAVAKRFSLLFSELFGGGNARLVLNRDQDGSEPGIEIVAQPPGKRSQNLSLLSGGERALTAAALMFAVLETVPTAFSVLDEVDAALDDVNVVRFCQTLAKLAQRTQFVIITHNRGTMDIAETIYGVSMNESHSSRVLSVKMPLTSEEAREVGVAVG